LNSDGEDKYEGEWIDGQRTGIGAMKVENGDVIQGLFEHDE